MRISKTGINGKALCILDDGRMLIYRKGWLKVYSKEYKCIDKIPLIIPIWKKIFGKIRIFERLLHIEPRFAVEITANMVMLQLGRRLYMVNLMEKTLSEEKIRFRGRPLGYAKLKDINGFDDSIVIGDYGANEEGKEVNIYQKNLNSGKWRVAFTFAPGTMWHIHGFVPNKEEDCVYILTGDEDDQSGIWKATENFEKVVPIVKGSQQYRTCQMTYDTNKIYYFTDAPSELNYLYSYNKQTKEKKRIAGIRGTCIYGCIVNDGIVVSTTCEPEAHFKSQLYGMITRKPGKGVCGREVDLLYYKHDGKLVRLEEFKHDGLPLKLFQYGTIVFSNCNNGKVLFTPISVKKYDMRVFQIEL